MAGATLSGPLIGMSPPRPTLQGPAKPPPAWQTPDTK